MKEYHFDQGPFGHVKTKPTTVGTNMEMLEQLDGVRGAGSDKGPMETNLEARMAASKKWAAWAPGMKKAIAMAVRLTVEQVKLKRLSAEQWRAHLANDHLPFHRGCRTCLEGAGKARYHRRVVSPESYTLAIDLAGPFKPGRDQEGVGRYIVVGTYTVPVTRKGRMLMDLAPERLTWLEGPGQGEVPEVVREMRRWKKRDWRGTGAGGPAWRFVKWRLSVDLDTHEILESKSMIGEDQKAMQTEIDKERNLFTVLYYQEEDGELEGPPGEGDLELDPAGDEEVVEEEEEPAPDDGDEWLKKIEEEKDFEVRQLTLVEIVKTRGEALEAIAKMTTKLRYHGLPVRRLHSD